MSAVFAIKTDDLGRVYKIRGGKKSQPKELVALSGVDLEVPRGEFFGLLGPNGAGKTTLIKILTTLLAPSHGRAMVAGYDVLTHPHLVRPRINMVSGGESSGYGLLTVRENLWMFGQFYGLDTKTTHQRIDRLLAVVGLQDRANTKTSDLSTGLRRKMNIVRGFITDPEMIFLDEPTLGLDVSASREVRQFVRQWVTDDPRRTMLLTTHYMAEADELCDRVAIINAGRVLACDTPANLKHRLQRDAIFHLDISPLRNGAVSTFDRLPGVRKVVHTALDGRSELQLILEADDALSGAIFPLTILPAALQPIGFILPLTYWLELLRRALLGPGAAAFPTLAAYSNAQLLGILAGITLASGLSAMFAFRYFDRRARELGLIDTQSNF